MLYFRLKGKKRWLNQLSKLKLLKQKLPKLKLMQTLLKRID